MPAPGKGGKGKKGPVLPPKLSSFTDKEWQLAHSVSQLLELLAAADKGNKEKPPASKQTAALWLWQLLVTDPNAKDEASKAKAVEVVTKLLTTPGSDAALSTYLLGCCNCMATPASDPQAAAACEALLAVKPPLVPWLLKQLEASGGAGGLAAAALGVLHALLVCPQTCPLVAKVMAGWNQQPLVAALNSQQLLPLMGGRNAAAHAAGILELILSPPPTAAPAAAAAAAGGAGKDSKDGKATRAASASSKSSSGSAGAAATTAGGAGSDGGLTAALQAAVVVAGGLSALLKVCVASGSTAACRCSAVTALYHLLATQGHQAAIKQQLLDANGLSTLVQIMGRTTLPLAARAAAAGCIQHYLTPTAATPSNEGAIHGAQGAGHMLLQHTALAPHMVPPSVPSRPGTTASLSKSIIHEALQQRRQQHQVEGGLNHDTADDTGSRPGTSDSSHLSTSGDRGAVSSSTRTLTEAAGATRQQGSCIRGPVSLELAPAPADVAAAAILARHEGLMAQWDATARKLLATCAEQVVAAGALPGLLLLCCGREGPPEGLEAAAVAAAAAAAAFKTNSTKSPDSTPSSCVEQDKPAVPTGSVPTPSGHAVPAPLEANRGQLGRRATVSAGGAAEGITSGETLDSITEPPHAIEGEDEESTASDPTDSTAGNSRVTSADTATRSSRDGAKPGGKKAKKNKKASKLDPAMVDAQGRASAAVKLLALVGDEQRSALMAAGALPVLLPLLDGSASIARWNARQALLTLSLVSVTHTGTPGNGSSSSGGSSGGGSSSISNPACSTVIHPAAGQVSLPGYISLSNMPASHWQPVCPMSMPPQPPLPVIPGRNRGEGGAAGAPGSTAAGAAANRPGSQGRRTSVSNLTAAAPASQASRMSSTSSFMDGPVGPSGAGGGGGRTAKGPRTSMAMAATAAAAALAMQAGSPGGAAVARTSSTAATAASAMSGAGQGSIAAAQQQGPAETS